MLELSHRILTEGTVTARRRNGITLDIPRPKLDSRKPDAAPQCFQRRHASGPSAVRWLEFSILPPANWGSQRDPKRTLISRYVEVDRASGSWEKHTVNV